MNVQLLLYRQAHATAPSSESINSKEKKLTNPPLDYNWLPCSRQAHALTKMCQRSRAGQEAAHFGAAFSEDGPSVIHSRRLHRDHMSPIYLSRS